MEYMPELRLIRPASVAEAVSARRDAPEARLLAGGTDIVPNIRRGIVAPGTLIDVSEIAEMGRIEADVDGLRIGAAVTLTALGEHPEVRARYPVLVEAATQVAARTHRNVATVGGNLCLDTRCVFYNQSEWWRRSNDYCFKHQGDVCHVAPKTVACFAAYSGDVAPALIVLDAEVEIASADGVRVIPLPDLYREDGRDHVRLDPDELVVAVRVPNRDGWRSGYAKARVRSAIDFPLAGVAAAVRLDDDVVAGVRVALTGTNPRPLLVEGTEAVVGQRLEDAAIARLVDLIPKQIQPMTSTFTPPGYRRRVVANMTRSLLRRLSARVRIEDG